MDGRAREWLETGSFFDWAAPEPAPRPSTLRIFHAEFGDPEAPLVLLLHGFPTSSVDWYDVVGPLSTDHRVCVLDFPGFGFSDKPKHAQYTLHRDCTLVEYYLNDVLDASAGVVIAHDRGDSVALVFAARCAVSTIPFELEHLVLSNGNMFLPLSNLTSFQRLVLDPVSAPQVLDALTPELLASGMGETTFSPPRSLTDPAIAALMHTFAVNDGMAVIHDTIQYLVERSENEQQWLEALARSSVPTTLVWGLYDTVSPLRVAAYIWDHYLATKPGTNEFWLLPRANHYLQHDQPTEFIAAVLASLSGRSPIAPGPVSTAPGAPIMVDRSRTTMPSAQAVLASSVIDPA